MYCNKTKFWKITFSTFIYYILYERGLLECLYLIFVHKWRNLSVNKHDTTTKFWKLESMNFSTAASTIIRRVMKY